MAESTLSLTRTELRAEIGKLLGYSRTVADWTVDEIADVDGCLKKGLTRFYAETDWFFLAPEATITTAAADYDQALPDDFASMRGCFRFPVNTGYREPRHVGVAAIRDLLTHDTSSGIMTYFALESLVQTGASGQRWQVLWYPPPDAIYVMTYQYNRLRDALTAALPYPAGGAFMSNAILEACLAAAELSINRQDGHEQQYQMFLAQAFQWNARNGPGTLGPNLDRSDGVKSNWGENRLMTYNGVVGT